jgi:S-formylglutathione hydrolase FrmB
MNKALRAVAVATLFLSILVVAPARAANNTGRAECLSINSAVLGAQIPYCVLLPPSYDHEEDRRYPVLYFLHGLGDNEQMFVRSGGWSMTEDLWEKNQMSEFLVVTPAGDASFYINSRDGRHRYQDFLINEFIPYIERHFRVRSERNSRGIAGISMGGYGALHLAFVHPELFRSVSAQSPALIDTMPAFTLRDADSTVRLRLLGEVFGSPPDQAFWDRNSPITLAKTADLKGLKIYLDCGSEDDYGFNVGTTELHKILTSRAIPNEFHIYPGGHNWPYFAEHLAAVLQFHAHAFAATTPVAVPKKHS